MRVKYYMRGIGIGILLAILIFSFDIKKSDKAMSDKEIIEAARELGMVDKDEPDINLDVLKKEPTVTVIATPKPTQEPEPTQGTEPSQVPEPTQEAEATITFVIEAGMYSEAVAKTVEEAGLIQDWKDFNNYLIRNGYASSIRFNEYTMKKDATYHEIAELITRRP